MAKGTAAKSNVIQKIKNIYGADFIGEYDKKIYVWEDDNGERIQIAIALICPKNFILNEGEMNYNTGRDFSNDNVIISKSESTEITSEERDNVRKLMAKLGL